MAFSLHIDGRGSTRSASRSGLSPKATLIILAIIVLAAVAYDMSPSGDGHVSNALGQMQRSFQGFVASFKLRR